MLAELGRELTAAVCAIVPAWVEHRVGLVVDAWGRLDPEAARLVRARAGAAGVTAAQRIAADLGDLVGRPAVDQRTTPMQVIRTCYREPTEVLREAGIPPVVRDPYDERAWPDDRYGLVPRHMADLGNDGVSSLHLAWGAAKARAWGVRGASSGPPTVR